jgi:type IV secretory pathway protease TraF
MSNITLRKNQKNQLNNTGINQQKLRAFAGELAKDIHTQDDLAELSASLVKMTGSGKSIKQFYYEGTVPKNQAVVWGSNLESFDSRYWGFIEYRQFDHNMGKKCAN